MRTELLQEMELSEAPGSPAMQLQRFQSWDFVFIRYNRQFIKLHLADILYLESRKNYTRVVTARSAMMVLARTRYFEEILPASGFCRIHRSFIVRLDRVENFDSRTVMVAGEKLPVGSRYLDRLIAVAPVIYSRKENPASLTD